MRTFFLTNTFIFILVFSMNVVHAQESLLERGDYLINTIVACGNCHTPKTADAAPIQAMEMAGAFVIKEEAFTAYAPNITMDLETGIGSWTNEEIIRSIRDGIRPDGSVIGPPMPSPFYRNMSDRDVRAVVAYLRSIKPVKNVVPKSEYRISLPPNWGPPVGEVPEVPKDDPVIYARYFAQALGHCNECHTPVVEGQHDFSRTGLGGNIYDKIFGLNFTTVSANITPHKQFGIGNWTDEEIKAALTDGIRPDGRKLARIMANSYYRNMSDADLNYLVLYMRSLKPQPEEQ